MMRVRLYLEEILECIANIRDYTKTGRESFFASRMMQDAVIRNIEIIGEATRNVPEELKATESAVPWRNIAAMRNLLIHRYFRIDLDRVWDVVQRDLDELEAAVKRLLSARDGEAPE